MAEEKKAAKGLPRSKAGEPRQGQEELIGKITHYFGKIEVGIVEITKGGLATGDTIHIKGSSTDFEQPVESIQIEHEQVEKAKKGDAIGLKVKDKVREGDEVYKIVE